MMWEHALGIKLCQCLPVGVCYILAVMSLTLRMVLRGPKHVGGFMEFFSILMCVNMFLEFYL